MEYKASDDSKMKDMGDTSLASIGIETHGLASEVVKGFNFSRLHERYPELNRGLTSFHNYLVGADVEEEALKIWDIRDLGLQATQRPFTNDDGYLSELTLAGLLIVSHGFGYVHQ
jgi:UDP-glucose:glycoprotein glucosyltransferase